MSLKLYYSYYWLSVCDKNGDKSAIKPIFKDRLNYAAQGRSAVLRADLNFNAHLLALKRINRVLDKANKRVLDKIASHDILK